MRRSGITFWAGVAVGLLASFAGLAAWLQLPVPMLSVAEARAEARGRPEPVHVLVMGLDERGEVEGTRTDTMMLVRVDGSQVRTLSIPRDTLVDLEEHGEGKANSAYTYGGAELAKRVVGDLLDVQVDYHVTVDLSGFRELIDVIGGVDFDVPKRMEYYDPTDGTSIDLEAGPQRLNGDKALQFVRYRYDEMGDDMGRIHRQHEFLKAAAGQALTAANLPRLPQLLLTARQHVETDIPLAQQVALGQALFRAQQEEAVLQETLPGHGEYVDGLSFYLIDEIQLADVMANWQNTSHP